MHGSPVAGGVGVFAREEEGVGYGLGELARSVEASRGDVAVGSEREGIAAPVVGVAADEELADLRGLE